MSITVPSASNVEIWVPQAQGELSLRAGELLRQELTRRIDLDIRLSTEIAAPQAPKAALRIAILTIHTVPPSWQERLDPPVRIYDYPDHAEYFSVRTVSGETVPTRLLICGSEKSSHAAAGAFLRSLGVYADRIEMDEDAQDYQPLTPVRGIFYANHADSHSYFNFSEAQWEEEIRNQALWGSNTFGWVPAHFPDWPGLSPWTDPPKFPSSEWRTIWETHWNRQTHMARQLARHGLRSLVWFPLDTAFPLTIPDEFSGDRRGFIDLRKEGALAFSIQQRLQLLQQLGGAHNLWLSTHSSLTRSFLQSPLDVSGLVQYIEDLQMALLEQPVEIWLGTGGLSEDILAELFNWLQDASPLFRAILSGPGIEPQEMIFQELPFSIQLATLTPLSQAVRLSGPMPTWNAEQAFILGEDAPMTLPAQLAYYYFDLAPMTYGALGFSLNAQDEVHRFVWSLLSWSPQPSPEESLEMYGRWFFGAEAAPLIKTALLLLEASWKSEEGVSVEKAEQALERLHRAEAVIPPKLRPLAQSRLLSLRLRALLDIALKQKQELDRQGLERLLPVFNGSETNEAEPILQKGRELIRQPVASDEFNTLLKELGDLRKQLFDQSNTMVLAVDRVMDPSPDRNWLAVQIEKGLQSQDPSVKRTQVRLIREQLQKKTDPGVIHIECGNLQQDRYRVRGLSYLLDLPNRQWLSAWWALSISENEGEPVIYRIPLNPLQDYELILTYNSNQNLLLRQSFVCRGTVLHDSMEIKPNTPESLIFRLTPESYPDGRLDLSWFPEPGCRAGVAEILLKPAS